MQLLFNKITLLSISFLSFCLIVIGYILQTVLIPLQDINSISSKELVKFQKEYAINYPLGTGLLYLGLILMILVIILFIIKLKNFKSARIGKVLIGSSNSRGKGYGTQLMLAALKFAFEELKLHKVTLGVFDFNTSAIKCYEKVGFKQEGILRDARKNGDEYWNLIEMGILENEWLAKS